MRREGKGGSRIVKYRTNFEMTLSMVNLEPNTNVKAPRFLLVKQVQNVFLVDIASPFFACNNLPFFRGRLVSTLSPDKLPP